MLESLTKTMFIFREASEICFWLVSKTDVYGSFFSKGLNIIAPGALLHGDMHVM